MAWTNWRKIAVGNEWFDEEFDHDGPACYELGIGRPRGRKVERVYVGETDNEQRRVKLYAQGHGHIEKEIRRELRSGYVLYYRGQAKSSKGAAKKMQDRLLEKCDYPWNGPKKPGRKAVRESVKRAAQTKRTHLEVKFIPSGILK